MCYVILLLMHVELPSYSSNHVEFLSWRRSFALISYAYQTDLPSIDPQRHLSQCQLGRTCKDAQWTARSVTLSTTFAKSFN